MHAASVGVQSAHGVKRCTQWRHTPSGPGFLVHCIYEVASLSCTSAAFKLVAMALHSDLMGCFAQDWTPTPSMRWANRRLPSWGPEGSAGALHKPPAPAAGGCPGICHQPYTLPTCSDQTWKEVWESLSGPNTSSATGNDRVCSDSETSTLTDEALTDSSAVAAGDAGGKFPQVALDARCTHQQDWQRLRGKRGYSYFRCAACGLAWRQPTLTNSKQQQPSTSEPSTSAQAQPQWKQANRR